MVRTILLLFATFAQAAAQQGTTDLKGTIGYTTFLDEGNQGHVFTGAALRHYLTRRLSVEPEFLFLYKDKTDKDVGFQANLAFDLARPNARAVPYLIGGVGVLHTIITFNGLRFTTTEALISGGIGAKIYVSGRWFIAPEFRLGWETIVRGTVSVGYSWR